MVTVTVSETYDISTKINKMSLIAVHSPTKTLIQKTYPGLAMNCKYWRIKGVDVRLVAVSSLPISPDQVGDDVDKIAPQDMLNPILYKAVSNDSWSTLEARLAGLMNESDSGVISGTMADCRSDKVTGLSDDFGVYYSLLSHRDGFKVAHPQQGLAMKGLKPLVFEAYYSHGENQRYDAGDVGRGITYDSDNDTQKITDITAFRMRGRPHAMPRMNTTYLTGINPPLSGNQQGVTFQPNGMGNGHPDNHQIQMPDVAPIMMAGIILPPAKRTIMYYRMVCRAYIEFTDIRPIQEITAFSTLNNYYYNDVYHTDYVSQSSKMDATTDMVDVKDADIEKVMEGR